MLRKTPSLERGKTRAARKVPVTDPQTLDLWKEAREDLRDQCPLCPTLQPATDMTKSVCLLKSSQLTHVTSLTSAECVDLTLQGVTHTHTQRSVIYHQVLNSRLTSGCLCPCGSVQVSVCSHDTQTA